VHAHPTLSEVLDELFKSAHVILLQDQADIEKTGNGILVHGTVGLKDAPIIIYSVHLRK